MCRRTLAAELGSLPCRGSHHPFSVLPLVSSLAANPATAAQGDRGGGGGRREEEGVSDSMDTGGSAASSSSSSLSSSAGDAAAAASASSVFHNYPFFSAMIAFAIAQSAKLFTTWYKERRWDAKQLIGSGGMPSSHSATVTALAVAVGLQEGLGGSEFAISMILACVVMHDAFSVRLQAGRQAEVLNQIVFELPPEHPLADISPLRELLGHTPLQVIAGAVLGCITAVIARVISIAGS